jgi:[protein-PII] uridylyltransferase
VPNAKHFDKHPLDLLRIFRVAQKHDLDIQPMTFTWIAEKAKLIDKAYRENPEANAIFMKVLTSRSKGPEVAARRMNEAGVFGRFVPDFGRVVAQMQYDMYHSFTVDEHTLMAIGILHRIEEGALKDEVPIASDVVHKVLSRRVLYVAVLLRDIAKGRNGDHSVLGAELAEQRTRASATEDQTETVAWLVRHHLLMSNTAFKRDLDDSLPSGLPTRCSRWSAPAIAGADRRRHPRGGPQDLERLEGAAAARPLQPHRGVSLRRPDLRGARARDRQGAGRAQGQARRLAGRGTRGASGARASGLLALVPDAAPGASCAAGARCRDRGPQPVGRFRVDPWEAMTEVTIYVPDRAGLVSQLAGACASPAPASSKAHLHPQERQPSTCSRSGLEADRSTSRRGWRA